MVQPAVLDPAPVVDTWRLGEASAVLMRMIGFEPTGEYQAAILRCRKRNKLVVGGGQAGKSLEACADWVIHLYEDIVTHPGEPLLYWLVAADYERTRREFEYIQVFLGKLGKPFEASKRVDPGFIEVRYPDEQKYRIRIETKSGKDPRTLSMFSPHGIIGCEASQIDLETHWKCIERLTASGGWLHYSGTYEGSLGWYPSLAAAWTHGSADEQSFRLPSITNKHLYPGGIDDPKIQELKRKTSDAFFFEKIMGIASPPRGMVFSEFRPDIHIREVSYNPDLPIFIWGDPGHAHAHAIEIAHVMPAGQVQVFDEIFERGIIVEDLIDICMRREWWKNPVKTLVVDPNYSHQHHGTYSMADIWLLKTGLTAMGVKVKVKESIERLKSFLKVDPLTGTPGIVFSPRCRGVLSEFGAYPDPFDGQTRVYSWKMDSEGNIVGEEPDPRWNDGVSAIMYGLVERFGLTTTGSSTEFVIMHHGGRSDAEASRRRRASLRR